MNKDDKIRIIHIIEASEKAIDIFKQFDDGAIKDDEIVLLAATRCFSIIGEAANKVSKDVQNGLPHIPWREMIDMRNRLVHVYYDMDWQIIERAVYEELPALLTELKKIDVSL